MRTKFEIVDEWEKIIWGRTCAEPKVIEIQKAVAYSLSCKVDRPYKISEITMNECGQCFDQNGLFIGKGIISEDGSSVEIDLI